MLTLLVGGARSGKSTLAVQAAERQRRPVTFVATAEPFDDDMADRIDRHRLERPAHWTTVECPLDLADALSSIAADDFVIVDCLTVWLGNLFVHERSLEALGVVDALRARTAPTVVVTNEVGMGIHPDNDLGRRYRDDLGRLNQAVAAVADTTLLLVAGRAVRLHDPWELLG